MDEVVVGPNDLDNCSEEIEDVDLEIQVVYEVPVECKVLYVFEYSMCVDFLWVADVSFEDSLPNVALDATVHQHMPCVFPFIALFTPVIFNIFDTTLVQKAVAGDFVVDDLQPDISW